MAKNGGKAAKQPRKVESKEERYARLWRWAILWIAAAALLLFGLGARSLWGSEGRWAEVVREMFATGDFLHPRINWEPYFDKPLVSYWFIAACAWFKGGVVNEFLSRLPSALAALAALAGTASLGKRLFPSSLASYYGCWILLTAYSFAFWGRTAAADMANVAFTILPLAWYFARKERPGFLSYFVFFALCAIGGQTKGLGAIAIPVALAGLDMLMDGYSAQAPSSSAKTWLSAALASLGGLKRHIGWQSALAALCGAFVYFIPFLLEALTRGGDYASSGLELVFRENIQRFFSPFDHDEPFYVYFIYLPQLFLPWTPFLILAGVWAALSWKTLDRNAKWLCLASLATFAIFTVSGSRRVYYILPLLPLCALLCGAWLASSLRDARLDKLRDLLFKIFDQALFYGALITAVGGLAISFTKLKIGAYALPPQICVAFSITGAFALLFRTLVVWRLENQERCKILTPGFLRFAIPVWIVLFAVYTLALPSFDAYRTGKPFGLTLSKLASKSAPEDVFFYKKAPTDTVYYMGLKGGAPLLKDEAALAAALAKPSSSFRLLISEQGYYESLPPELKSQLPRVPLASEPSNPWEKSRKRKLLAFQLPPRGETPAPSQASPAEPAAAKP